MKTTVDLDEKKLRRVMKLAGLKTKKKPPISRSPKPSVWQK
jgi:hypothetical protein